MTAPFDDAIIRACRGTRRDAHTIAKRIGKPFAPVVIALTRLALEGRIVRHPRAASPALWSAAPGASETRTRVAIPDLSEPTQP